MSVSLKIFSFNEKQIINNDDIGPATTIADRLPLRGDLQETKVLAREANYIGLNHYKHRINNDSARQLLRSATTYSGRTIGRPHASSTKIGSPG